jgi:NH3-dependent NAD+ synthetase
MFNISPEKVIDNIGCELKNYCAENRVKNLIVEIYGDIDSAVLAAIHNYLEIPIPLIGVSFLSNDNKKDEIERAQLVGKEFCNIFIEQQIENEFKEICNLIYKTNINYTITNNNREKELKDNIKQRIKTNILYSFSELNKGIVLSSRNYTDYLLGFYAQNGNEGHLGLIQNLWKTEIYNISDYLINTFKIHEKKKALLRCRIAKPVNNINDPYKEIDDVLKKYLSLIDSMNLGMITNPNIDQMFTLSTNSYVQKYQQTHNKRLIPYNVKRNLIIK